MNPVSLLVSSLCTAVLLSAGTVTEARSTGTLDPGEQTHLVFMREEEKLARDVYITLGEAYPALRTFGRIDDSEQNHTDTMAKMLDRYHVQDPSTTDEVGVFTGEEYGWYFAEKFEALVVRGLGNAAEALLTGAFIEELDMHDIVHCPEVIVETDNGIGEDECGMLYTDEALLVRTYGRLVDGSENHLRAFVRAWENMTGGTYEAQYLTQDEVDEILGR